MTDFDEARAKAAAILDAQDPRTPSPPPATPTPPPNAAPLGMSAREFFATMSEMEKYRRSVIDAEFQKMKDIESIVASRVDLALKTLGTGSGDPMDPILMKAGEKLLEAWAMGAEQRSAQKPIESKAPVPIVQTEPSNEVEPVKTYTQEDIDKIADIVEDYFPKECKDARSGALSKEAAIAMIIEKDPKKKTDHALAERIYDSIMAVEEGDSNGEVPK